MIEASMEHPRGPVDGGEAVSREGRWVGFKGSMHRKQQESLKERVFSLFKQNRRQISADSFLILHLLDVPRRSPYNQRICTIEDIFHQWMVPSRHLTMVSP